jgi:subtilisin family serine protease
VSPILGIIASQNYPRITSSYESIATVTVGSGGQASVSFTSIPATFTHLQIRGISKNTTASTDCNITINSGTAAAYRHQLLGDGSATSALANSGNAFIVMTAGSGGANIFDASVIDFLDYTSTNKNRVARALSGRDLNGSGLLSFGSALWTTTTAISEISITPFSGNIAQYSSFALYGIKGA